MTKAIKSILGDDSVANELSPAFQKYNEEQFTTTKLPGGATEVLVSEYNALGDGRYYDIDTQSSFDFDHATGKASAVQSHVLESEHEELVYVFRTCTCLRGREGLTSRANKMIIARA